MDGIEKNGKQQLLLSVSGTNYLTDEDGSLSALPLRMRGLGVPFDQNAAKKKFVKTKLLEVVQLYKKAVWFR